MNKQTNIASSCWPHLEDLWYLSNNKNYQEKIHHAKEVVLWILSTKLEKMTTTFWMLIKHRKTELYWIEKWQQQHKKLVKENKIHMKNVNNTVFWDSLPWTCYFNNVFVVKSLHFLMILNSLPTILGLSKSGGWLNKLLRTAEIWFCFPLHFREILWIALVSRREGVGGGWGGDLK